MKGRLWAVLPSSSAPMSQQLKFMFSGYRLDDK